MAETGVIILAHGSSKGQNVSEIMTRVCHSVKARIGTGAKVIWAALQFNHPSLAEAVDACVEEGVRRVVIMPYFLFEGMHITHDIPAIIDDIRRKNAAVEIIVTRSLGYEESLTDLVTKRLYEAAPELLPQFGAPEMADNPRNIESLSMDIIEDLLSPLDCSYEERQVIKRIVHASGDPQIAHLVRFSPSAISSGLDAIAKGSPIFTDVSMVAVGINSYLAKQSSCSIFCALTEAGGQKTTEQAEITRASAAMRYLGKRVNGSIVAIGNAPTALLALLDLIDNRKISPALVIGMPVGFVQAKESKDELMKRDIPYITIEGIRGGSAMAAATVNTLLKLACGKERVAQLPTY